MSIEAEAERRGIDYRTEGDRHCRPGWVQFDCPNCYGRTGKRWHLGYSEDSKAFNCWSCGKRDPLATVMALFRVERSEAYRVLDKLRSAVTTTLSPAQRDVPEPDETEENPIKPPYGVQEVSEGSPGSLYLRGRGFDSPVVLARLWGIRETGPLGPYKFRLIAPVFYEGREVSYQGRDFTGSSGLRYKACRKEDEKRDHQSCLYGEQLVPSRDEVLAVEGIVDAWKMGPGTVATFGTAYTTAQVNLLAEYERVTIVFDSGDEEAKAKGRELANELAMLGVKAATGVVDEIEDPGAMPEDVARVWRRRLLADTAKWYGDTPKTDEPL